MGVMKCDRKGCDNIMCESMINNMYYRDHEDMSEKTWYQLFDKFMKSKKTPGDKYKRLSIDEFLEQGNIEY